MSSWNKVVTLRQKLFIPWAKSNAITTDANDDLRMAVGDAVVAEIAALGVGGILLDNPCILLGIRSTHVYTPWGTQSEYVIACE